MIIRYNYCCQCWIGNDSGSLAMYELSWFMMFILKIAGIPFRFIWPILAISTAITSLLLLVSYTSSKIMAWYSTPWRPEWTLFPRLNDFYHNTRLFNGLLLSILFTTRVEVLGVSPKAPTVRRPSQSHPRPSQTDSIQFNTMMKGRYMYGGKAE